MKRRYKLLLIILGGIIITLLINGIEKTTKLNLVSLGDGVSLGMTPYNVAGTSFNDYLKEMLETENEINEYNNEFSQNHLTIHNLNEYLEENKVGKFTRVPIKQTIASADIITISIGVDELADISLNENISTEIISNYLEEMDKLLKEIREFYQKEIILISLYPAFNLNKSDVIEINSSLAKICGKYDTKFLDILAISLNENYYLEKTSYYLNYEAHNKIAIMIYEMLK